VTSWQQGTVGDKCDQALSVQLLSERLTVLHSIEMQLQGGLIVSFCGEMIIDESLKIIAEHCLRLTPQHSTPLGWQPQSKANLEMMICEHNSSSIEDLLPPTERPNNTTRTAAAPLGQIVTCSTYSTG
tara:strand:+ start:1087 stop:1470 length:384 start_codon:yes stop_codon:yes gene_type:complete